MPFLPLNRLWDLGGKAPPRLPAQSSFYVEQGGLQVCSKLFGHLLDLLDGKFPEQAPVIGGVVRSNHEEPPAQLLVSCVMIGHGVSHKADNGASHRCRATIMNSDTTTEDGMPACCAPGGTGNLLILSTLQIVVGLLPTKQ